MGFYARVWLNPLLGIFRPWEEAVLKAVCSSAPGDLRKKLMTQANRITLVLREDHGRTANLYSTDHLGRVVQISDAERLDIEPRTDTLLARVMINLSGEDAKVLVYLANGRIFSMSMLSSGKAGLDSHDIQIRRVDFLLEADQSRCLACLPSGFDTADPVRLRAREIVLLSKEDLYVITVDGKEYCVLGMIKDDSFILTPCQANPSGVYRCREDGHPEWLADSFDGALDELDKRAVD